MSALSRLQKHLKDLDIDQAIAVIHFMESMGYPQGLVDSCIFLIETARRESSSKSDCSEGEHWQREFFISPKSYLLHRPDLRALNFTKEQLLEHLYEYGQRELIDEVNHPSPPIRRYLDLNDSPIRNIALLVCHASRDNVLDCSPLAEQFASLQRFTLDMSSMTVESEMLDHALCIQEFAAYVFLHWNITHLCFVDSTDVLAPGWEFLYSEYLKNKEEVILFCEEYVNLSSRSVNYIVRSNRQYKSSPSDFRLFTRGYLSGIVAIPIASLCDAALASSYPSSWLLQVDLAQQSKCAIHVINQPLLLRNQVLNPAILEYSTTFSRKTAGQLKKYFYTISSANIFKYYMNTRNCKPLLSQKATGEIIPKLTPALQKLKISVIIPFRDNPSLLEMCVSSLITQESLCRLEVVLADNGSSESETMDCIEKLVDTYPSQIISVRINEPFNFSRVNNIAARSASGDYILFLNNDIEFKTKDPIASMLSYFQFKDVGAVGAKLHYVDGSIQHSGIVITHADLHDTFSPFKSTNSQEYDYALSCLDSSDQWSAATAACLLVSRETWDNIDGFDEELAIAYNDIDLCLRIQQSGKCVIVDTAPHIIHHESKTRGFDLKGAAYNRLYSESGLLRSKHSNTFTKPDEYWSQSLSTKNPRATPSYLDAPYIENNLCDSAIESKIKGFRSVYQSKDICIFAGFNVHDRIRPDVLWQVKCLADYYDVIFVSASKFDSDPLYEELLKYSRQVILRKNIGYDFGSWRCGILENLELISQCSSLLLVNDSLYGPIKPFEDAIIKTLESKSDITAMTINRVGGLHAQSYYVGYRPSVFNSPQFKSFWKTLPVYGNKYNLICTAEIGLSRSLLQSGKTISALYDTGAYGNQTHINWKDLVLQYDYPFLKNELLLRNPVGQNLAGISDVLSLNSELYSLMLDYWDSTDQELAFKII